ncbi:MAG TPA: aminotransferase class I/II-fold pyridoxal phosphate-dependent enzyme [Saprospiraceae bacterium]|nr:aminotransferase class I/II-fold pyridoxal phosphate-dependent enzyme [Saprospiraceae bacterium]
MSKVIEYIDGRRLKSGNIEYRYFAGTAYLGIPYDADFQRYLHEGMMKYGSSYGGSRRSNFEFEVYAEFENWLAGWLGAEKAITLSSGTLAGQLLRPTVKDFDHVIYLPSDHPAVDYGHGIYLKNSKDWHESLQSYLSQWKGQHILIVSATVENAQLSILDVELLSQLYHEFPFTLLLDDSHGIGVLGTSGSGISSLLPASLRNSSIIVGSLGKAMGLPGGFVAGNAERVSRIAESPLFGGSSPLIPASIYAFEKIKSTLPDKINALKTNIALINTYFPTLDQWKVHPQLSIATCLKNDVDDFFLKNHCLISSFAYPTLQDPVTSRLVFNALHTPEDIEWAFNLCRKAVDAMQ